MARSTDGLTDLIDFGDIHALYGTGDLSVAAWIRADVTAANFQSIFSSGTSRGGGGNDAFNFAMFSPGIIPPNGVFVVQTTNGGTADELFITTSPNTNWHHWGMVYTLSGTALKGYYDGSSTASGSGTRPNPVVHTKIGCGTNGGGVNVEFAKILAIADAAVWTAALTAGEIAAMAAGVRPYLIRPSSLVFYAPIDGLVSPEPELSGNKNNGALTGTLSANGPPLTLWTPNSQLFSQSPPSTTGILFSKEFFADMGRMMGTG